MTSTLTSMRRLSVRVGPDTVDLAVPIGTRLGDLLASGGFPPGSHLVDASGAALPDDDRVGDTFQDGALVYVVDAAHTPSLTRVTPAAPSRGAPGAGPTARATDAAAAPNPAGPTASAASAGAASAAQVQIDAAAAGARTRSSARRAARGRPGTAPATGPSPAPEPPSETTPVGEPVPGSTRRPTVVPPLVRRAPGTTPSGGTLPRPPGVTRPPVPLPPGRAAGRGAHAARHGADTTGPSAGSGGDASGPTRSGPTRSGPPRSTEVARRAGTVAVPPPPRVAPPPSGATGRGAVGGRGSHRPPAEEQAPPRARFAGPADVPLNPGVLAVPTVFAAACAVLVLLATLAGALPTWSTWASGAALLVSAVVAAVRPGDGALQRWARVTATGVGGVGGFVLAVSLEVALDVSAVSGLVVAAAVAMLGRVSAVRQGVFDPWITVAAVSSGALAADAALAIALSWPLYVGPLLLAGVSPLIMRSLPALSLDVPEEQLVDTERLSNTSWSARTGVKRKRRPLRQATVELITLRASGIVAAGTITIAVFVVGGYGVAVLSTPPGQLARWSLLAEGVLLLGGIGLAARTVRARFGKRVLRFTAAAVTLETGFYVSRQFDDAADLILVVLLVALALGVVGVSLLLGAGWQSLRLSRLADVAEGFCVVFALPAALLAVDTIAVLRQAAS